MTTDIRVSLSKLHSISQEINQASDSLTAELNFVEAALGKLNLGVSAWARMHDEDSDNLGGPVVYSLGYSKLKGKWGLLIEEDHARMADDFEERCMFLRHASRELRMEAAEHLGTLLENLCEKGAKLTEEITKRASEAKEIATVLGNSLELDGSLIEDLELSVRSFSEVKNLGITSVRELVQMTEHDLSLRLNRRSLNEVKEVLAAKGLSLRRQSEEHEQLINGQA